MSELERRLEAVGESWFPATPEIAARARARLPSRPTRPRARLALVAAAVTVALAAAVLAVSPGARSALVDLLDRVPGIHIERVDELPRVPYDATPYYGVEMGIEEAEGRFGRPLALPRDVGDPERVHWLQYPPGDMITAIYDGDAAGARLVFSQWKTGGPDLFYKTIAGGTIAEPVTIDGAPGLWISGGEHVVWFEAPGVPDLHFRAIGYLAGNVLAWRRGDVIYRLEADVTKAKALELAGSVEER